MAKGNMLLGQARGKVGDIVFSRNNGQQVIKARSANVKNPQTQSQVLQRILLNTVSQAYSKMIAIVDHSAEGVQTGQQTMSAFMKRNLNLLRSRVVALKNQTGSLSGFYAVSPIGSKMLALNPYVMSTGTLPAVAVSQITAGAAASSVATVEVPGVSDTLTYQNVISGFGLRRGDQLTFITLNYDANQGITFNFARIILDPTNADGTPASLDQQLLDNGEILAASERNEGLFARLTEADGKLNFSVAGGTVCGACVIVSREDETGEWMRSNSVLALPASIAEFDQHTLLDAIDAFYSGGIDFDSAWYLNNAVTSSAGGQGTVTPEAYVRQLLLNGTSILSGSTAVQLSSNTNLALSGTIANYEQEEGQKIVFSKTALEIDSAFTQATGQVLATIGGEAFTGTINLDADSTYHVYYIAGGSVKSKHRDVTTPEDGGSGGGPSPDDGD